MAIDASQKPLGCVQVDLDSLWAVRSVYGLPDRAELSERDPLWDLGVPRLLEWFALAGLRATFFALGRDCAAPAKRELLRRIAEAGHEIGNHSNTHPVGLGALAPDRIRAEIALAQDAIEQACGARPQGFRSPGYDASSPVLRAVAQTGLTYDSSVLPTWTGGLLRGVSRTLARGAPRRAEGHYGSGPVWRAPRRAYRADLGAPWRQAPPDSQEALWELPLSVSPLLALPVHASVAMAAGAPWAASATRQAATRHGLAVYAFHALDAVGGEEIADLLPEGRLARWVLGRPLAAKEAFARRLLETLASGCRCVLSREAIASAAAEKSR